jgi:casein kinase 1
MLVYFMDGRLPWQGIKADNDKEKSHMIMEHKMAVSPEQLCEGLPKEFSQFVRDVKALQGEEGPPYQKLRDSFRQLAKAEGVEYDNVFDWTVRLFLETEEAKSE